VEEKKDLPNKAKADCSFFFGTHVRSFAKYIQVDNHKLE